MTEENKDEKTIKTSSKDEKPIKVSNSNRWRYTTIALLVIVVLLIAAFLWKPGETSATGGVLALSGANNIANKTVDFLNENIITGDTKATLDSVSETSGMLNITVLYQGRKIPIYTTEDGKFLILSSPIDTTTPIPQPEEQTEEPAETPKEVPKTDKPEAHAFIMSYCPFGIQFLKAYVPVMELLGSKATLEVNFVDYAMHGEKELTENTRMYCIQKEQKDKLVKYLGCFVNSTDAEKCMTETKIDKAKLETCMNATDKQYNITNLYNDKNTWLSGKYPQYPIYAALAKQYSVQGSPTFVLNGVVTNPQRTPEAIKQAICSAFTTPPAECGSALNSTATATSGSCG